jgi:hypothetical protein
VRLVEIALISQLRGSVAPAGLQWRLVPIVEALRAELWAGRFQAPCRKLVVELRDHGPDGSWAEAIDGVLTCWIDASAAALSAPYDELIGATFDLAARGVRVVEAGTAWRADDVHALIDRIRHRRPLFQYELAGLSKLHRRSRRRARVYLLLTDVEGRLSVQIEEDGRVLTDLIIATRERPLALAFWERQPATSSIEGNDFVVRDRAGEEMLRLDVAAPPA